MPQKATFDWGQIRHPQDFVFPKCCQKILGKPADEYLLLEDFRSPDLSHFSAPHNSHHLGWGEILLSPFHDLEVLRFSRSQVRIARV